ncbi:MAG: acetate--CoA ligase family protein [Actinomycetes bacterium]
MTSLAPLWSAESIAIIGATERAGAMGRLPLDYLQRFGYQGKIFPVNPKGGTILGLDAYSSINDVPQKVQLALIMVPATSVAQAVSDCAKAGVGVAVVMSSGFAEADATGALAQIELVKIAKAGGMRLVGPNCIGSVGGAKKVLATFSPVFGSDSTRVESGSLALVSQSGALGYGTYSLAQERGLPIGVAVTTGNEADVTALEVASELAIDPDISGVLLYLEGLESVNALRTIASKKPTAILKAGRSSAGAAAAASHTGALASEDRVVDAAIKAAGAIRVNDVEHLLDAGAAFASKRTLTGKRVAIVTTSGGSGILAVDALEAEGLELAALDPKTMAALAEVIPAYGNATNPVDVTAAVMSEPGLFEKCLELVAADANVDAIVACFCVLTGTDVEKIANALVATRKVRDLPIVVARTGAAALAPQGATLLNAAQIPAFPTPERAVRALSILHAVSQPKKSSAVRAPLCTPLATPTDDVNEIELKNALASVGLPIPESLLATTASEALAGVERVGGRAVFKAVVPGLLHKSDAGGVLLDVHADGAEVAFAQLKRLGGNVLVERFVPKGVEALVGITGSALGRVLTVGVGGVLTEIISDVALRLLPVTGDDVNEMIDQTRLTKLFAGARGAAAADREAFVNLVLRLSDATSDWPAMSELDINPVTVLPDGAWILDAAYVAPGTQVAHSQVAHSQVEH